MTRIVGHTRAILTIGDKMKIGYACTLALQDDTKMRSCIAKNASELRLIELIDHNLTALSNILTYNHQQGIKMFRISSDIIPFGSSPINSVDWQTLFQSAFTFLQEQIKRYDMRVSMHPGQYTIINSPNPEVVQRAIVDLQYHCALLDLLCEDATHKMVLHVGGVYGDKQEAMKRFMAEYRELDETIKRRLIIENDDRYYTLEDVLWIAEKIQIPVVFDNLHHKLNPSLTNLNEKQCLALVKQTWKSVDGRMKMHYSEQDPLKRVGAHASSIDIETFLEFCKDLQKEEVDIMLEVKDKHVSALRVIEALRNKYPWLLEE